LRRRVILLVYRSVEAPKFTAEQRQALAGLLDDPSSTVRQALLSYFGQHAGPSLEFLRYVSSQPNRALALHANAYLRELNFSDPVTEFRGFIRSLNYELETGALLLSRTIHPSLDIGASCTQLDALANRCRELVAEPAGAREKCRAINRVLFHENGFRGNTEHYADPLNSFLDQVLARRKGLPITLSIVYLLVADRIGLSLEPIGLPGHFLVGCYAEDLPFYIDPFNGGRLLTANEAFAMLRKHSLSPTIADLAPTPIREVLCRCCRNLVNHYTVANEHERARLFAEFVAEFESTYERHAQS
jgi:regulator of sirC expression with transglutaminase-like and TPR domain